MNEFRYFKTPEMDRLVSLVWQMAQELHVTRRRVLVLEDALAASGALPAGALDRHEPDADARARLDADSEALLDRLFRVLTEEDDHRAPMREQFLAQLERERR